MMVESVWRQVIDVYRGGIFADWCFLLLESCAVRLRLMVRE
jgi:hypothetical protein